MKVQEEIGCWGCAVDGMKTGKPVCPECGTEIAHLCGSYNHEKVWVEKNVKDMETEVDIPTSKPVGFLDERNRGYFS